MAVWNVMACLFVFVVNAVDEFFRITIDFSNGFDLVELCCSIIWTQWCHDKAMNHGVEFKFNSNSFQVLQVFMLKTQKMRSKTTRHSFFDKDSITFSISYMENIYSNEKKTIISKIVLFL
jgi:hypothetical protein